MCLCVKVYESKCLSVKVSVPWGLGASHQEENTEQISDGQGFIAKAVAWARTRQHQGNEPPTRQRVGLGKAAGGPASADKAVLKIDDGLADNVVLRDVRA